MSERRPRRYSWNRSRSESFGPIRQVGIALSIGFPMLVVGILVMAMAYSQESAFLWLLGGGLAVGGVIVASSGHTT